MIVNSNGQELPKEEWHHAANPRWFPFSCLISVDFRRPGKKGIFLFSVQAATFQGWRAQILPATIRVVRARTEGETLGSTL